MIEGVGVGEVTWWDVVGCFEKAQARRGAAPERSVRQVHEASLQDAPIIGDLTRHFMPGFDEPSRWDDE